ncbi:MAG TPA: hypothetical protein VKX16_17345 [Chloroflexota bacterium]|nr:hypothetical protein [Chloroflexota bacterium]
MRCRILLSLALLTSLYASAVSPADARHAEKGATGTWQATYGPSVRGTGELRGVTALSTNDVWIVGVNFNRPFFDHWNGRNWARVSAADPAARVAGATSQLSAVVGLAGAGAWAVGEWGACPYHPLIERWTGRHWNTFSANIPATWIASLSSVAVVSATDAWAVGSYANPAGACEGPAPGIQRRYRPLVEHWNGKRWSQVAAPADPRGDNGLVSVSAISPRDIWLAGNVVWGATRQPLVERFDGRHWHIIQMPDQHVRREVNQIRAIRSDDVWLVGDYWSDRVPSHTLIEHWNGSSWAIIASPNSACPLNRLTSIQMLGTDSGWSVGVGTYCGHSNIRVVGLIEYWNGRMCSLVRFPASGVALWSLVFPTPARGWAVGNWTSPGGRTRPLIEQYLAKGH